MTTSFAHDNVFPIIQRVITMISQNKRDYVTHNEIVQGLLADSYGKQAVKAAQQTQWNRSPEQIASNMVAWFSQQITVGQSIYTNSFERKKIGGKWAYRPTNPGDQAQTPDSPPAADPAEVPTATTVKVTVADRSFVLSREQVLAAARQAMAHGLPTEANNYLFWAVEIDGQLVGAKWLLGLVTGIPRTTFVSTHARSAFERLGLTVRRIDSPPVTAPITGATGRQSGAGAARASTSPAWGSQVQAPTTGPHAILDAQVKAVRDFLAGRASRPSDEKLCDWVHFCYTFELYREASALFQLVDPAQVDRWQYERTKKLAAICAMKATGRA